MSAESRVALGSAPDSWGVWFPSADDQVPWTQFLDELAQADYHWVELGPHGYLPTDPKVLRGEVEKRGLKVSGGGVFGGLHNADKFDADLAEARKVANLVAAVGGKYLIYLPDGYSDLDGNVISPTTLTSEEWTRLTTRMGEIGKIVLEESGISLVFHPHADSHVGSQDEIYRLLNDTDSRYVNLCLDTGHVSYCGGDNLAIIERFAERVRYVHLKQVDPVILKRVNDENLGFAPAVRLGVMCEPPLGIPEMPPLIEALSKLDVDIYAIVEQDMYPCPPDVPFPIAKRTREYFNACGVY